MGKNDLLKTFFSPQTFIIYDDMPISHVSSINKEVHTFLPIFFQETLAPAPYQTFFLGHPVYIKCVRPQTSIDPLQVRLC